ncbi:MAG: IS30 family transposase [Acidobacteriota bacterium]|nr:IS30 family transposase [Acidobacteriota bacterium]
MKKYQQLTLEQRYQISALLKLGFNKSAIAREVSAHKSTIGRELRRNLSKRGYRPQFADRQTVFRRSNKVKPRITDETWAAVKAKIREQWSPEQISGRFALEGASAVSHEWIYQRIYRDKLSGGTLYLNLRCQKKRRKRYGSYDRRGALSNQVSIEQRPVLVDERTRLGDWELDTVEGSRHRQAIVSMTERKSKLLRIKKVKQKTGKLVNQAVCQKLNALTVHTLTSDNGREFAEHEKIAKHLAADFYFCHPYSSWERGLNENTNGLLRQYFPKKMELAKITDKQINEVEAKLNSRPRKTLGYKTPAEVYFKEQEQLRKVALTS